MSIDNVMSANNLRILISAEQIRERIAALAREIERDYADEAEAPLIVTILKGGFMFAADLMRELRIDTRIDFMVVSSYGGGQTSSGEVQIKLDLKRPIEGKSLIIAEDIIDTGITLSYIRDQLLRRHPKSLRIVALLDKPSRRKRDIRADYRGFEVDDVFVVGYGLDCDEKYRGLPDVCVVGDDGDSGSTAPQTRNDLQVRS